MQLQEEMLMKADKRFIVSGSEDEVYEKLQEELGIEKDVAHQIFAILKEEKDILWEDEVFKEEQGIKGHTNSNMLGLMIMERNYYINIKVITVILLVLLTNAKYGISIMPSGMNKPVVKIEEFSGMKCILLEILNTPNGIGKEDILDKLKNECGNNDLVCRFRSEWNCTCNHENVKEILEKLSNLGILVKQGEFYKYDPVGNLLKLN